MQLFPQVGQSFLDFELVEELGRGAFGIAYLARQSELGQRPVVLKLTAERSVEPQRLAQLQHSHIVPIHSVHHDGTLQGVCMPYFGRATLAHATRQLHRTARMPSRGDELLALLPLADRATADADRPFRAEAAATARPTHCRQTGRDPPWLEPATWTHA